MIIFQTKIISGKNHHRLLQKQHVYNKTFGYDTIDKYIQYFLKKSLHSLVAEINIFITLGLVFIEL